MMKITYTLRTASESIKTRKGRSFLTILGIVIAISAIILISSIGQGAENLILGEISGLGADVIEIHPGREPSGPTDVIESLFSDSLTDRDVRALRKGENVPGVQQVVPLVIVSENVLYRGNTFRPTIFGWSAEFWAEMVNVYPDKGRLFTESEIQSRAAVIVIGSKVKEELFKDEGAVGKNVRIKDKNFRVVGVLEPKGQVAGFDMDEIAVIPYTTAQKTLLGINHYNEIDVQVENIDDTDRVVRDIETTLRELHGITDPEKDDFHVMTRQQAVDQIQAITGALTILLSLVVTVALVVGGIGVMNIMLVSVTERTREIGLRKALGATKRDILFQFLIEAMMLTGVGGIIGIIIGALFGLIAAFALSKALTASWLFAFPISTTILALVVSALVGIVFGLYPAYKAAKKSPIEALRYE